LSWLLLLLLQYNHDRLIIDRQTTTEKVVFNSRRYVVSDCAFVTECHPRQNLINEGGHSRSSAKPVDLSVIRVGITNQLMQLHQLQQVSGVQKEYD